MVQRQNFTNCSALLDFLEMEASLREEVLINPRFPLNVPMRLAQKMAKNSLDDPLFLQFVPLRAEKNISAPGFCTDPVQDATFRKEKRLLQKYEGRALLLTTTACAMHCRFCFRSNFDYLENENFFEKELEILEQDSSLSEIILSGGDPLSLSNEQLGHLIQRLALIPHLKRLRFHTRFPVGIPERIDEGFLKILKECRLQTFFVLHCNHPKELDGEIFQALKSIQMLGIPVLNQAVLLKNINDAPETLKELMQLLADHGILPYYLHQLDKVEGGAHFEVEEEKGRELIAQISSALSGYAVPKYVREIPGKTEKTLLLNTL